MLRFICCLSGPKSIQGVPSLGWVDFDLDGPPSWPAAQPLLPNFHQPKQNWADGGTTKIEVIPTQVPEQMKNPVVKCT